MEVFLVNFMRTKNYPNDTQLLSDCLAEPEIEQAERYYQYSRAGGGIYRLYPTVFDGAF